MRADAYPLCITLRTAYADMDAFRHINNGATGRYFEEGRADLNMRIFGQSVMIDPQDGLQLLFARVMIDYLAQIHYPGNVEIATSIVHVGTSSYRMQQALFQNGHCCALSTATQVKARHGKPDPLTEAERAGMLSYRLIPRLDELVSSRLGISPCGA